MNERFFGSVAPKYKRRRGFTLLELVLTLSMTVVLMALVNSAFDFYTVEMDSSDEDMRRTMLASAVMQMIENDLRASLHPVALDTTALEALLSSTAAGAAGQAGGDDPGAAAASGLEGPAMEDEAEDTSAIGESTTVLQTPGLIGNQFQLQIDTSRLPRLEEYSVMMDQDPGNLSDIPSDLKTVTYYVQSPESSGVNDPLAKLGTSTTPDPTSSGGLVRRVLDRSASTFASLSGNIASLDQSGELLAPEVTGIEFSYWDGITWQLQWNSDELGELPLAVKIQMSMTDLYADANGAATSDLGSRMFQHVVRLPMGKYIEEEEDELSEAGL